MYSSSSATNRLLTSKDHAAVQINVGKVNEKGLYTKEFTTYAFCGFIRHQGASDACLNKLAQKNGFLKSFTTV